MSILLLPTAERPAGQPQRHRLTPRSRYPTVDPQRLRAPSPGVGPLPKLAWIFGLRR